MKNTEVVSHGEIMVSLSDVFRDLISTDINHRHMGLLIGRGKAIAGLVTAMHREELMEMKRNGALLALKTSEQPSMKKLKPNNK